MSRPNLELIFVTFLPHIKTTKNGCAIYDGNIDTAQQLLPWTRESCQCGEPRCIMPTHWVRVARATGRPSTSPYDRAIASLLVDLKHPRDSHWPTKNVNQRIYSGGTTVLARSLIYSYLTSISMDRLADLHPMCGDQRCANPAHMDHVTSWHKEGDPPYDAALKYRYAGDLKAMREDIKKESIISAAPQGYSGKLLTNIREQCEAFGSSRDEHWPAAIMGARIKYHYKSRSVAEVAFEITTKISCDALEFLVTTDNYLNKLIRRGVRPVCGNLACVNPAHMDVLTAWHVPTDVAWKKALENGIAPWVANNEKMVGHAHENFADRLKRRLESHGFVYVDDFAYGGLRSEGAKPNPGTNVPPSLAGKPVIYR